MNKLNVTGRTKVNRLPKRASYDKNVIYKILDSTFVCHIAFKIDKQVYIIPIIYGRKDDYIFVHGSKNSRMLKLFEAGGDVSLAVTLVDGIVLARSAFHHSINYRSVIIFGKPQKIETPEEKNKALEIIFNHMVPGRWNEVRKPNTKELKATSVFSLKINEASAKVKEGGPNDEKEDLSMNVWAGIIPLKTIAKGSVRSIDLNENIILPEYLEKL